MAFRIPSGGNPRPTVFVLGERPGYEEWRSEDNFVGPAGQELWSRLRRICGIERKDCYVANLVRTFSTDPPSAAEVARDWPDLQADLARTRPTVILTVGYHAARALLALPPSATGDSFHGLVHELRFGPAERWTARVVPSCHSAAALRQPERYQNQLTHDLRVLADVLDHGAGPVAAVRPLVARAGLARLLAEAAGRTLGLDTEGGIGRPWPCECVSLSDRDGTASLVETYDDKYHPILPHLQQILHNASRVAIHHSKHDYKTLLQLGIEIPWRRVDDTMEMAYLLGLPQGLKELMRRRHHWLMEDYDSLIVPMDEGQVRVRLAASLLSWSEAWRRHDEMAEEARKTRLKTARKKGVTMTVWPNEPSFPKRALTSIKKMLTTEAEATLRDRWEASTFSGSIPLSPVPTWKDLPVNVREPYALTDAAAHRTLREDLWPQIVEQGLEEAYRIDMNALPFLIRNEMVGLACDRKKLEQLSATFSQQFEEACREINDLAGYTVNPLSGEQVSDCLFTELGIEPTRRTKSGKHHTTADKYLKARRKQHEIIPLILTARQLNKYLGTYTKKLPQLLQQDEAGHWAYFPDWKYTRTATGRLAEVVIVLIPKHDPLAKKEGRRNRAKQIRNCFHARPGNVLVSVDLSQIELRVMAHLSEDPLLLQVFNLGQDPHADTAHRLLGAPKERHKQDDSAHRLPAKTVNFGIINGMTEFGLLDQLHEAGQLHWTIDTMRDLLDSWWETYTGVGAYWDREIDHAHEHGWIREGLFGRRRELTGIWTADDRVYAEAKRQCLFGIQSAADSISKVWGARLMREVVRPRQKAGVYCEPWIRVHDDTTLEVAASEADAVQAEMLGLVPQLLDIPTPAEGKQAERWGDL